MGGRTEALTQIPAVPIKNPEGRKTHLFQFHSNFSTETSLVITIIFHSTAHSSTLALGRSWRGSELRYDSLLPIYANVFWKLREAFSWSYMRILHSPDLLPAKLSPESSSHLDFDCKIQRAFVQQRNKAFTGQKRGYVHLKGQSLAKLWIGGKFVFSATLF